MVRSRSPSRACSESCFCFGLDEEGCWLLAAWAVRDKYGAREGVHGLGVLRRLECFFFFSRFFSCRTILSTPFARFMSRRRSVGACCQMPPEGRRRPRAWDRHRRPRRRRRRRGWTGRACSRGSCSRRRRAWSASATRRPGFDERCRRCRSWWRDCGTTRWAVGGDFRGSKAQLRCCVVTVAVLAFSEQRKSLKAPIAPRRVLRPTCLFFAYPRHLLLRYIWRPE